MNRSSSVAQPSKPFVIASFASLVIGIGCFLLGLWNATMQINEKGFYFVVLLLGLYSAISIQKAVRDKAEGVAITGLYVSVSWFAIFAAISLLVIGLWNAELLLSEKGFYGIAFTLSLFSVLVVQKNTRDSFAANDESSSLSPVFSERATVNE